MFLLGGSLTSIAIRPNVNAATSKRLGLSSNDVYRITFILNHPSIKQLFNMRLPSFDELALDIKANGNKPIRLRYAANMHPNPYFYKYYWWVFWLGCPIDGREFLSKEYELCTHDAFTLLDQLRANGESWILYNKHSPRYDLINTPFDFDHPQWKNRIVAPAFEQDTDPIWISKSGVSYK